jgi:hypothetical protein
LEFRSQPLFKTDLRLKAQLCARSRRIRVRMPHVARLRWVYLDDGPSTGHARNHLNHVID